MKIEKCKFIFLFFVFFTFPAFFLTANENELPPDIPLHIEVEDAHYDLEKETVDISGDVTIEGKDFKIKTSQVKIDRQDKTLFSTQTVRFQQKDVEFTADGLNYNYDAATGRLARPVGCVRGVNIAAEEMTFEENSLLLSNVRATTCELSKMDYHITARSLRLDADGRANLKKTSVHLWNRRLFTWGDYSFSFASAGDGAYTTARPARPFSVSPLRLGYNRFGGILIGSSISLPYLKNLSPKANINYFFLSGFFPEIAIKKDEKSGTLNVSYGKQWKENTGYFRYLGPVVVWNLPNIEYQFKPLRLSEGLSPFQFTMEGGRMRDSSRSSPIERGLGKVYFQHPIGRVSNWGFSLIADARGALYAGGKKYGAAGAGVGMGTSAESGRLFGVQFMHFDQGGAAQLFYDRVDPNDKLFINSRVPIAKKIFLSINAQYDLEDGLFDEVEYRISRTYNCVKTSFGWRTERRQLLFDLRITNLSVPSR
ncbi:MAG: LPS export ABC transporter periplasmic protein LptC [bacterium]